MRLALFSAALAGAAILAIPASAQTQQERARSFVDQVSLTTSDNALARWDRRLCVGAVGLEPAQAQQLVDRISSRAHSVGLRPGEPGCQPNVMVIFAPDSDTLTRQIVEQRRDLLYGGQEGQLTAGGDALADFTNTPRPVRWWHISSEGAGTLRLDAARARQASGRTAAASAAISQADASGQGSSMDMEGMDAVRTNGSRAREELRNELSYVLVIVDARRVANVPAPAWMDYVALVSLAQIDPSARPIGYPSVLNLFGDSTPAPTALTAWDIAYLDGLYRSRGMEGTRQAADIARRMADDVR
jgi:hypothetical protein